MMFRPSDLFYSQNNIRNIFQDRRTLDDSLRELLSHTKPGDRLPLMDVMLYEGRYYVVDGNRRLYLLKQLESAELVDSVSVNMRCFDLHYFSRKFTTKCKGESLYIRNDCYMENKIKKVIKEHTEKINRQSDDYQYYSKPPTPARQVPDYLENDHGFGYNFTRPPTITIEPRHDYGFGNIKYRWVIKGISMSPEETAEKLCEKCNTERSIRRAIVSSLDAIFQYSPQQTTTGKLEVKFCKDLSNSELCNIYLDGLDGTYENQNLAVKSMHTLLTQI